MKEHQYYRALISICCLFLFVAGCSNSAIEPKPEPTIKGVDAIHAGLIIHSIDDASGRPVGDGPDIIIRSIKAQQADWNRIGDAEDGTKTFILSDSGLHALLISVHSSIRNGYYAQSYYTHLDTIHVQFGHSQEITERLRKFPVTGPPNFADSLIACYRFSGNALDSSKNQHDGVLHGCTFDTDRFGKPSSALRLKHDTDFVSIMDAPDLNFGVSQNFTIVFWCTVGNEEEFGQGPDYYFVHKGTPARGYAAIEGYCGVSGAIHTPKGVFHGCGDSQIANDKWEFFAIEFNRIGTITEYGHFGSQTSQMVWCGDIAWDSLSTTAPLCIGGTGDPTHAYKGRMDDVRIFKGLLTPEYLDSLYHEGGW